MGERRECGACGRIIKGRPDKKFCDGDCRNEYNNELRRTNTIVRTINNTLGKNRRILKTLLPKNHTPVKVPKEKLVLLGFSFDFFTHNYIRQNSKTYCYCYEYGYLPLENGWYLIVRDQKYA